MPHTITERTHRQIQEFIRRYNLPPQVAEQIRDVLHDDVAIHAARRRAVMAHWASMAPRDPELGGHAMPHVLATARQAVERFGGARLKRALDETGLGNHPEVIRAFYRIGATLPNGAESNVGRGTPSR